MRMIAPLHLIINALFRNPLRRDIQLILLPTARRLAHPPRDQVNQVNRPITLSRVRDLQVIIKLHCHNIL